MTEGARELKIRVRNVMTGDANTVILDEELHPPRVYLPEGSYELEVIDESRSPTPSPAEGAPPSSFCEFLEPRHPKACRDLYPLQHERWCGACLMQRYEPERFAREVAGGAARQEPPAQQGESREEFERDRFGETGDRYRAARQEPPCICTPAEIALFGTPDPLCGARTHVAPAKPPTRPERSLAERLNPTDPSYCAEPIGIDEARALLAENAALRAQLNDEKRAYMAVCEYKNFVVSECDCYREAQAKLEAELAKWQTWAEAERDTVKATLAALIAGLQRRVAEWRRLSDMGNWKTPTASLCADEVAAEIAKAQEEK